MGGGKCLFSRLRLNRIQGQGKGGDQKARSKSHQRSEKNEHGFTSFKNKGRNLEHVQGFREGKSPEISKRIKDREEEKRRDVPSVVVNQGTIRRNEKERWKRMLTMAGGCWRSSLRVPLTSV